MRKLSMLLASLGLLIACNQNPENFTVEVELEGSEGKWITLSERIDREFVVVDSALAEAGNPAVLTGKVDGITTMYLALKGERGSARMLIENATYKVSGSLEDPVIETRAKAQSDMNAYEKQSAGFDEQLAEIIDNYYAAAEAEDSLALDSIIAEYEAVNAEKSSMDSVYLAENTSSAASVLILRNSFYSYDTEDLEAVLLSLDEALHSMSEYSYMFDIMTRQKEVAIGKSYKDFGLPTPDGEMLNISDIHNGQVLLIDFWASWCGPCRRANPEVVAMYQRYHEQGFDIIGVSLDSDRDAWLKAIEDDQLSWHHISDIQGWNCEGSKLYGVPAIPHTVLIDREGIIRYKNLHGDEMATAIEKLL